jgi:SAM-dependent methyltransferase
MRHIDFMTGLHSSTKRDYLARVNDVEYPKPLAAKLAKKWAFDYWDGDRRINYGGYKYIPGRWRPLAERFIEHYNLDQNSKILDIGCGKGFLLYELQKLLPKAELHGIDLSSYALENAPPELNANLHLCPATEVDFRENYFDLAFSLNTFHCLNNADLEIALQEIKRVSKDTYICMESYDDEESKANLLYWQVTCEQFNTTEDWQWWFKKTGYDRDYSFIFFR